MSSILSEKWLWIIIFAVIMIVAFPLLIVYIILLLPFPFNTLATILLIIGWGIAAGYKEWIISKEKEQQEGHES